MKADIVLKSRDGAILHSEAVTLIGMGPVLIATCARLAAETVPAWHFIIITAEGRRSATIDRDNLDGAPLDRALAWCLDAITDTSAGEHARFSVGYGEE